MATGASDQQSTGLQPQWSKVPISGTMGRQICLPGALKIPTFYSQTNSVFLTSMFQVEMNNPKWLTKFLRKSMDTELACF